MPSNVAVVIGSTRPTRITSVIAEWLLQTLQPVDAVRYEMLDLAAVGLPFLDEPLKPALGGYVHEHTRRWSRTIAGYDGFVFVFPQYNWGYPAPLKNALDFLYAEWGGKAAGIVCHGTRGGGRAAAQLREVLLGLHMQPLDPPVLLSIAADSVDASERLLDAPLTLEPFREDVLGLGRALDSALAG